LYDANFASLQHSRIDVIASTTNGQVLDTQTNGPLGDGDWGAELVFPLQAIVYTVYIYDHVGQYSPAIIEGLNGDRQGRLDMVISPVPSGPGGLTIRPRTLQDMTTAMRQQQGWTNPEREGVIALVRTVLQVEAAGPNAPRVIIQAAQRWRDQLDELGVDLSDINLGSNLMQKA
jgi:hypothetical protein